MFFLVGSGRCGTTLLQKLLDAHPKISVCNEARVVEALRFFNDFAALPAYDEREFPFLQPIRLHGWVGRPYVDAFATAVKEHTLAILARFFELHTQSSDAAMVGDKLPGDTSTLRLLDLLPDTRFVLLSRDPRDVYCSWQKFLRKPEVAGASPLLQPPSVENFAHEWKNYYAGALTHLRSYVHIRYRDLVRQREHSLKRVMDYLGFDTAPEQLAHLEQAELFAVHGTTSSPECSIGRWRTELCRDESRYIDAVCGDVMEQLGHRVAD